MLRVGEVLEVGFEVAGEVAAGLAEDGQEDGDLLAGFLPPGGIGLVAEGVFDLLIAVEGEVDAVGFAVFEEVAAAFAFGFVSVAVMVEGGLIAAVDVEAQRVVGGILAVGVQGGRGEQEAEAEGFAEEVRQAHVRRSPEELI